MKILDSKFMKGFIKMADDGFQQGWHEDVYKRQYLIFLFLCLVFTHHGRKIIFDEIFSLPFPSNVCKRKYSNIFRVLQNTKKGAKMCIRDRV